MVYLIDKKEMGFWEKIYIPEIIRGMCITGYHFFRNLFKMQDRITVEYPENKKTLPPGCRTEPRLTTREDGSIRCSACMLCVTVCPSACIEIRAEEVADSEIEKRARSFQIDMSRCILCGMCAEACPCDAIRLDSGKYENAVFDRSLLIYNKDYLLSNYSEGSSSLSRAL